MNPFKLIFRNAPTVKQPVNPQPVIHSGKDNSRTTNDASVSLAVSKAVRQLEFIARSYSFTLCDASIDDLKADMETMLRFNDLSSVRLELLGRDGLVLFEFKLRFNGDHTAKGQMVDTGSGIELPVLDRDFVSGKRLVIQRNGVESTYKNLLRLNWGDVPTIAKSVGAEYESEHAAKISGGRQTARFHITNAVRHRFVVTQNGTKGFGFAKDLGTGRDGVFVLAKHLPAGIEFKVGAQFTGVLIQTPKGMQVRSILST